MAAAVAEPSRVRQQLAAELRALRTLRKLTQREIGPDKDHRLPQARVWRIERAETLPRLADVTMWLDATDATHEQRNRVVALLEAAHKETRPWPEMAGEERHLQRRAADRDVGARLIRAYSQMMPGLLQTAEYARLVIAQTDPASHLDHAAALAARMERQRVLYEEGRQFQFLIAEHALRWSPGPGVMPVQLDRLVSLSTLAAVELRVLPDDRVGTPGWHAFVWRQPADGAEPYVTTELVHGGQVVSEPAAVKLYESVWDQLWSAALAGDDALALVRAVR